MPGGGGDTKQETTYKLSPEQREIYRLALPFLKQFGESPPSPQQESGVAGFDPLQSFSQRLALGAAPQQGQLAQSGADATNFLLKDVLSPDSNPYLQQTIDASVRPIQNELMESTLPGLRGGYATSGASFGNSRRGIAEGLASGRASQAIGDTAAKVATTAYGQGLDAQGRALAMLPQTQDLLLNPARTVGAVGDVRQSMQQAQLSDRLAREREAGFWPGIIGKELLGMLGGIPGGTSETTASGAKQNPFASFLGTALTVLPMFL